MVNGLLRDRPVCSKIKFPLMKVSDNFDGEKRRCYRDHEIDFSP